MVELAGRPWLQRLKHNTLWSQFLNVVRKCKRFSENGTAGSARCFLAAISECAMTNDMA